LKGQASFAFEGTLPSTPTTKPMMVGTQEPIAVIKAPHAGAGLPALSVVSSAPNIVSVAQVICCNGGCDLLAPSTTNACTATLTLQITVNAVAAGSATLMLVADDGTTFDEVNLTVAEPTSLTALCAPYGETETNPATFSTTGSPTPVPASMKLGAACALTWTATDASGDDLMASTGVTFTSSNPSVLAFESAESFVNKQATTGTLEAAQGASNIDLMVATGTGESTVVATARAMTLTTSVEVTP
jgi:hypothetical protein